MAGDTRAPVVTSGDELTLPASLLQAVRLESTCPARRSRQSAGCETFADSQNRPRSRGRYSWAGLVSMTGGLFSETVWNQLT